MSYKTWGTLNADASNGLFVCHALTGNASLDSWWGSLLGPGKPFDTDRFFVVRRARRPRRAPPLSLFLLRILFLINFLE